MSRNKNTVRNTVYAALTNIVQQVMTFAIRTAFIYLLGAKYLGLNGVFVNILQILNIVELGIGTAIAYSMYKPVAENDTEKIKTLVALYRKVYYILAAIIMAIGVAIIPFIPLIIPSGVPDDINIHIVYSIFLLNTIAAYFVAHKRTLIYAYQRNDVLSKLSLLKTLLMMSLQMGVLFLAKSYYYYIILLPIFTVLESVAVWLIARKMFPDIKGKAKGLDAITKNTIIKNTLAISITKIMSTLFLSSGLLIISFYWGLETVARFSNYILITETVYGLFIVLPCAASASIGNYIATESREKIYVLYKFLTFGFMLITGWASICLFVLFNPFIDVWLGDEWTFGLVFVLLLALRFFVYTFLNIHVNFLNCAGIIWKYFWPPILQTTISITLSLILCPIWGVMGVVFAELVALIVPFFLMPIFLNIYLFKENIFNYFLSTFFIMGIMILSGGLVYYLSSFLPSGLWLLPVRFAVAMITPVLIFCICFFWMKEFKQCFQLFKNMLSSIFKRQRANIIIDEENKF